MTALAEPPAETLSQHVDRLSMSVAALSQQLGVEAPQRCVGDECLELSTYLELLEVTKARLEAQLGAAGSAGLAATGVPLSRPASLTAYLLQLEGKVTALCAQQGVPVPQQCDEESCLDLQSYVELLEQTLVSLNDPQAALGAMAGTSFNLTEYVEGLEAKVATLCERENMPPPQQCIGDLCMTIESYIELLEETVAELEAQ